MSPLSKQDRDELTHSTDDILELIADMEKLNLSTTWGDFVAKAKTLAAEHGPEIAMAVISFALRAAGVAL